MKLPQASRRAAFTLIEVLTVIAIILVLVGLTIGISGTVRDKGARSRAETEIAALSAALESYRIDNGAFPSHGPNFTYPASGLTETLVTNTSQAARRGPMLISSLELYRALSGDTNLDGKFEASEKQNKTYFEFRNQMLDAPVDKSTNLISGNVKGILDPWGNPYGYYVPNPADATTISRNPTFDMWSEANSQSKRSSLTGTTIEEAYIKNW